MAHDATALLGLATPQATPARKPAKTHDPPNPSRQRWISGEISNDAAMRTGHKRTAYRTPPQLWRACPPHNRLQPTYTLSMHTLPQGCDVAASVHFFPANALRANAEAGCECGRRARADLHAGVPSQGKASVRVPAPRGIVGPTRRPPGTIEGLLIGSIAGACQDRCFRRASPVLLREGAGGGDRVLKHCSTKSSLPRRPLDGRPESTPNYPNTTPRSTFK